MSPMINHVSLQVVTSEMQTSLENRLSSDETLKKEIREVLLPSWQRSLDLVLKTFEASLQHELTHYLSTVNQVIVITGDN